MALVERQEFAAPPARNFAAKREVIETNCARIVTREFFAEQGKHRYQLWEPVIGDTTYAQTREYKGKTWGLARTRRFWGPRPDDVLRLRDVLVEHELKEARRAIDVMRRVVPELSLKVERKKDSWSPAGFESGIYEDRGDIYVSCPEWCAQAAAAQRGS
ncbi:hypothetical protein OV079_00235 [Nannocystis pusilla]|nr:hypothetical protein [Nannocystis pusilla]MCY1004020.1 hypothetical protein [Nannocystis pusilla]